MESEETQETENQEQPSLGVVDIQNCVQIIDVASRRGAFQGNELSQVGTVRDKLDKFVQSVMPEEGEEGSENEEPEAQQEPEQETQTKKSTSGSGKKKTTTSKSTSAAKK